jgi:hypothetical protein
MAHRAKTTDAPIERVPAERFNLTTKERAMLADPDWITEDDADAIIVARRGTEDTVSFEQMLRENGIRLER